MSARRRSRSASAIIFTFSTNSVAPSSSAYLPGGTLETLASGGNDQLAWGAALGLVVLYGVIATIVSLAVFRTRDIIS
jgi:xanthine/uracil/vitamin C permease (AzgA family)